MQHPTSPLRIAFIHRCPRCRTGALYIGYLTIRESCPHCGLDYTDHDVGDGPAFFALTILCFFIVAFATALEILRVPYWINMLGSAMMLAALTPLLLRWFKSYLVALKYNVHWKHINEKTPLP
jgi:uncharacterized protein (DUF983 family)